MSDYRARLLTAARPGPIEIPYEGCSAYIRKWTAGERMAFMAWVKEHSQDVDYQQQLLVRLPAAVMCDPEGNFLFTKPKADGGFEYDLNDVAMMDGELLELITMKALRLNGIIAEDAGGKSIPNSDSPPSSASPSAA